MCTQLLRIFKSDAVVLLTLLCYWRCCVIDDVVLLTLLCYGRCYVIDAVVLLMMLCYWRCCVIDAVVLFIRVQNMHTYFLLYIHVVVLLICNCILGIMSVYMFVYCLYTERHFCLLYSVINSWHSWNRFMYIKII